MTLTTTFNLQTIVEQDIRYFLGRAFLKTDTCQQLATEIKEAGHFQINHYGSPVQVYSPSVAAFFVAGAVEVQNSDNDGAIETINAFDYLPRYVAAFKKGAEYFNETYRVSANTLFGPEAEAFGANLHYQYNHSQNGLRGWNEFKNSPLVITYRVIEEYGYYAGVLSGFDQMAHTYPAIFKKYVFSPCNHDQIDTPGRANTPPDTQKADDTPDENTPYLSILAAMQTRLFSTLSPYTPENQHGALSRLIEKGQLTQDERVWVKLKAGSLVWVFKQAREEHGGIVADMQPVARWLAAWLRWGETSPKAVSYDTAYKILRGNVTVERANQIRLK